MKHTREQLDVMYWLYRIEFQKNRLPLDIDSVPVCKEEWLNNEYMEGIYPQGWEEVFKEHEQIRKLKVSRGKKGNESDMATEFCCGGVSICRQDYMDLPCSMDSEYFTDALMQKIAEDIDTALCSMFGVGYKIWENADIEEAFWEIMESVALEMGMDYFEDYPFDVDYEIGG